MKVQGNLKIIEPKSVSQAVYNELYIKKDESLDEIRKKAKFFRRRKASDNNEDSKEGGE